jgi:LacI family transcriptional regulator
VAAGVLKAALQAGIRVPEQIAVIGAGNVHYSDLLRVPLSTIDQHSTSIGEEAADLLLEVMRAKERPEPRKVFLEPTVIARESTRRNGGHSLATL